MGGLKIGSKATTVSELLAPDRFYRIPPYQRSYSWLNRDALLLLNDLQEAVAQERSHFLGAIVTIVTETPGLLELADGQQRLTTLTLILALLRDSETLQARQSLLQTAISEADKSGSWRITPNHVDAPFLRQLLRPKTVLARELPEPVTESHELLRSNYMALEQEISCIGTDVQRKLQDLILFNCPIIEVSVANRDEGYKVFQVLNARGRQPNGHDILKTELFERARLTGEEADRLARIWSNHEARLGARDFDDLLRQIRLLFDPNPKGDLVSGFCASVLSKIEPKKFLEAELPKYVDAYVELKTGRISFTQPRPEVDGNLNRLRALEHNGWRAPALKFLVAHDRDADTAREFFCDLERLGYAMQLVVSDREARPKRYRKVCEDIDSDRQLFARDGALALSVEERQKLAQRLTGRFGSVSQRRALCMKINALLDGGESLTPDEDATVEHILPRSVSEDSEWARYWPDLTERRELADTLGNFCLLSRQNNQKADRLSFREKRDRFFLTADGNADFAITREAAQYHEWTPDVVRARTHKLVGLLITDWKLDRAND